eukprot:m.192219 g.192219  ORF g.192219 m.192219 type:complete len:325 (-) comp18610_c0_seq8:1636-2610(-)
MSAKNEFTAAWQRGEQIGNRRDIALVQEYVQSIDNDIEVIAVFTPSTKLKKYGPCKAANCWLMALPCYWICCPCVYHKCWKSGNFLSSVKYVLTNKGFCVFIKDYKTGPCCSTGTDWAENLWMMASTISVNQTGRGCACCNIGSSITFGVTGGMGLMMAGVGSSSAMAGMIMMKMFHSSTWFVDEPAKVASFIKAVQNKYAGDMSKLGTTAGLTAPGMAHPGVVQNPVFDGQSAQPKAQQNTRIFVSTEKNTAKAQILMIDQGTMSVIAVVKAACAKLNISYAKGMTLVLVDGGVEIDDAAEIQAGDKFMVRSCDAPPQYQDDL